MTDTSQPRRSCDSERQLIDALGFAQAVAPGQIQRGISVADQIPGLIHRQTGRIDKQQVGCLTAIAWSGRRRYFNNILVERLWQTLNYEEVYLRASSDGQEAETCLAQYT